MLGTKRLIVVLSVGVGLSAAGAAAVLIIAKPSAPVKTASATLSVKATADSPDKPVIKSRTSYSIFGNLRQRLGQSAKPVSSLQAAQQATGLRLPNISSQLGAPLTGVFVDSTVGKRVGDGPKTHNVVVVYGDEFKVFRESGSELWKTQADWYSDIAATVDPPGASVVTSVTIDGYPMIAWSQASRDETVSPDGRVVSGWAVNNSEILWFEDGTLTYVSAPVASYSELIPAVLAIRSDDKQALGE